MPSRLQDVVREAARKASALSYEKLTIALDKVTGAGPNPAPDSNYMMLKDTMRHVVLNEAEMDREFELIAAAAEQAYESGLRVNAGHGLNYVNTTRVASLESIEELSIGHAIMARAIFVGLDQAVREMLALMM